MILNVFNGLMGLGWPKTKVSFRRWDPTHDTPKKHTSREHVVNWTSTVDSHVVFITKRRLSSSKIFDS